MVRRGRNPLDLPESLTTRNIQAPAEHASWMMVQSDPQNDTEDELSDDVDLDLTALDPKELKRVLAAEVITQSFFPCSQLVTFH